MTDQMLFFNSIKEDMIEKLVNTASPDGSADDISGKGNTYNLESEDELSDAPMIRSKRRIHNFSDSTSESDKNNLKKYQNNDERVHEIASDIVTNKKSKQMSRIRKFSSSDDDMNETAAAQETTDKYDLSRVKNKKKKLREKFRNLVSKQGQQSNIDVSINEEINSKVNNNVNSDNSDEEQLSCNKIKQTSEDSHMMKISEICDPDLSSDEDHGAIKHKKISVMKSTRLTSSKPIKISAKQAVENMQKIKSESNRMLREKEVSLPYHRPKALSLKDIMSRRKPALAPDGKVLSVKMTHEQLEQYALQLEQRQKEMMELCKSDSEEEDEENKEVNATEMDEVTNIQMELENKTLDVQIDAETVPMEVVEENNLLDNERGFIGEGLKSTEHSVDATTNAENMYFDKESNTMSNTCDSIKEMESLESNKEILDKVYEKDYIEDDTNKTVNNSDKDDSKNIELHYDSEKVDSGNLDRVNDNTDENISNENNKEIIDSDEIENEFLENDFNFDELDMMPNMRDEGDNSNFNPGICLNTKPKLTGAPGMFIDLEDNTVSENKLSGVEKLKERYKYFAKIKFLEEQEKDREKKYKPGVQLLILKQDLEEEIAEQRSIEWAKRLEQEKQQRIEVNEFHGDGAEIDDIEKVEAKLEQLNDFSNKESSAESEEELCEDDCIIEDKPRKKNPMIDEEAEESDEDAPEESGRVNEYCNDASDEDSSEDESSESEYEECSKSKKGRILKAFEDSDDEDEDKEEVYVDKCETSQVNDVAEELNISSTQDDELQLAQVPRTSSEDMISQVSVEEISSVKKGINCDLDLGSQTFSIANAGSVTKCLDDLLVKETKILHRDVFINDNLYPNVDSQELITPTQSQEIGDDILALCTGQFYDNPFVSQIEDDINDEQILTNPNILDDVNEEKILTNEEFENRNKEIINETGQMEKTELAKGLRNKEKQILSSILEELDNPQFDSPKRLIYFANDSIGNKENVQSTANISAKKKLVIDSDDEVNEDKAVKASKKKNKRRKLEQRALQFSDDEEEMEELESDIDENPEANIEDVERIVEYDSEENEVEVQPQKKKKKLGEFFEQEAELTSEDEWVGSGDEDEAGLDRMEREEGDDDVFHEGKLRKELGQIHMRDVLDQDKREVRLIQELLFEDGDLGDGHRQRKFRWKNADDTEETGASEEFADTQEEEFESEEQWRTQRHEREMFLRKMKGLDEDLNKTGLNRSALIKANLCSKPTSPTNKTVNEDKDKDVVQEKKTRKDIPSPKKPFTIFQQNYHGSFLSRGKGSLARLAAIATPLVGDGETTKVSSNRRNFVFAALSQDEVVPKVSKRKADTVAPSPVLIKKLKAEEKRKPTRSSLFDYLDG